MRIVGRKGEQALLKKVLGSNRAEFLVVYGRRRVGKTYLIKEFFRETFSFYVTGVQSRRAKDEISVFHRALLRYGSKESSLPADWFEAFDRLAGLIETKVISADPKYGKLILFFDELPWLDSGNGNFKAGLDYFWNSFLSTRDDVLLIVCGSATSWILTNLLYSTGGFYKRVTCRMNIRPFTLQETEELVNDVNGNSLSRKDLVDAYMVFGGIPHYLNMIDPEFSLAQNIDNLFFKNGGQLEKEYEELFASLFKKYDAHMKIVTALSAKKKGLTRTELLAETKMSSGATFTKILSELETCGFIRKYADFKTKKNDSIYQLTDPFILFSFNFLRERRFSLWEHFIDQPGYNAWSGYAFEMVCINHIPQIKHALGIDGIDSLDYSFSDNRPGGAQIDLLIDRRDSVINLCEIKYGSDEYVIDEKYEEVLQNKIQVFKEVTKTKKAIVLTLISMNGLRMNRHSGVIRKVLTMNDLF